MFLVVSGGVCVGPRAFVAGCEVRPGLVKAFPGHLSDHCCDVVVAFSSGSESATDDKVRP